ncbi:putative PEP-binding protein [Cucumibacter marinus]|uniref:putative PEP-binding protein n=1 Tax=Cucumibacter marinus TaxID=1121252 RepID=UPI00138B11BE|nr:putative PEP-binding protein [Cucumibacter marinus]
MSLAPEQEIVAIAPARGSASLSAAQRRLLTGKAKWLDAVSRAGLPVCPTVVITRGAWEALQAEKGRESKLLSAWVTNLLKLVPPNQSPPPLAVRTSAPVHQAGLARARLDVPAPGSPAESIDTDRPLARAIQRAFDSYGLTGPVWVEETERRARDHEIVIVQSMAPGALAQFLSRDAQTGAMGPTAIAGSTHEGLSRLGDRASKIAAVVDAAAGEHMACLVAGSGQSLVFLSARPVQVGAAAILEAARDRVESGVWSPLQAVSSIDAEQIPQLLHPRLASKSRTEPIETGLGVSPGAASGEIVFSPEDAARTRARGKHCILVAIETGPTDIEGMKAATGILTARGGMTSHAAVVARITGKPCVAGVRSLQIDHEAMTCQIGNRTFSAGDKITIEGTTGQIYQDALPLSRPSMGGAIGKLLDWADGKRTIAVRTNVETVEAARTALSFGAEGIGLARSEHMFFSAERMVALRRLILSESETDRTEALKGLVQYQAGDYADLFAVMPGKPVTVRLFDPPLHEFLPRTEEDIEETAASLGLSVRVLRARLDRLDEVNPMLGHRGCRLAISHPDILDMQVRALIAGLRTAADRLGPMQLEIMVPFVASSREVAWVRKQVMGLLDAERIVEDAHLSVLFGTMIELPRACFRAGEIARHVDFFSFGTNDLTQTTYGISRDDAPAFLAPYRRKNIFDHDPFVTIDQDGVGELIKMAIERGRDANPHLRIGICGEHAGDPKSLRFFSKLPIDYVSCSPYRVPVSRLVLAQMAAA